MNALGGQAREHRWVSSAEREDWTAGVRVLIGVLRTESQLVDHAKLGGCVEDLAGRFRIDEIQEKRRFGDRLWPG